MKTSVTSGWLYERHKEERLNYRLALDLKRHNWLLQTLKTANTKLSKRQKIFMRRMNKTMKDSSGKVVIPKKGQKRAVPQLDNNNKPEKMQKLTNNMKNANESSQPVGKSMPDITKPGTTKEPVSEKVDANQPYQVEPLPLLKKSKENNTEKSDDKHEIFVKNKPFTLGVVPSTPKSWFDTKDKIPSIHKLPISVAPEMKKYRNQPLNAIPPANVDKIQTRDKDEALLQVLYAAEIYTIKKLKDIIDSASTEKVNEDFKILAFLKTKGITLKMLTEIISDHDKEVIHDNEGKLENEESDSDVEFVQENTVPNSEVSSESIDSLVAHSTANKKIINLYAPKVGITTILSHITNIQYTGPPKNILKEAISAQTNQSDIVQELVVQTEPPAIKPIEIPPQNTEENNNIYTAVENSVVEDDDGHLVIEDGTKVVQDSGHQGTEFFGSQAKSLINDEIPQVKEDNMVNHVVKDMDYQVAEDRGFQIAEDTSYNVANHMEKPALAVIDAKPKSTKAESENVYKQIPHARLGRPQMGPGDQQITRQQDQDNNRNYQTRDPRYKNHPQLSPVNQFGVTVRQMPTTSASNVYLQNTAQRQIHPLNTFNNGTVGSFNQNMGFNTNTVNVSRGPYHPSNQINNNLVCDANNQCSRNFASGFNNHIVNAHHNEHGCNIATYDGSPARGYAPNTQYGNNTYKHTYSQNKQVEVIKNYDPRSQTNVTYTQSTMRSAYTQNCQAYGGLSQNIKKGGVARHIKTTSVQVTTYQSTSVNVDIGLNSSQESGNFQYREYNPNASTGQNNWGSASRLPTIVAANSLGPRMYGAATSMGNSTVYTDTTPSPYSPARVSSNTLQYGNIAPELRWQSRQWPQM